MKLTRVAEIIGGPRDGEFVPVSGAYLYEPLIRRYTGLPRPAERGSRTYTYWLRVTLDGQYHYVYRGPDSMS